MITKNDSMKDKIVVITGANSGIGKQTAIELARKGATIVMVCRNQERGEEARQAIIKESGNEHVLLELCDLSRMESIRGCGELMYEKYKKIDILINNAGAIFGNYQLTKEGMEQTFALNHMGYFLLTHYLLDAVKRGNDKRIINVASLAHKFVREIPWDDLQLEYQKYGQMKAYGLSKLYNIYFTKYLAQKLKQEHTQVTVNCLHPGTVYTGFGQSGGMLFNKLIQIAKPFLKKPQKGAETSVFLATSSSVDTITGAYFDNKKEAAITKLAQSKENAYKLWQVSMDIASIETYGNVVIGERR
jgi:NAD(P)-dependent dehydrogenase (short-subunit alcohol dehydrogenase family)